VTVRLWIDVEDLFEYVLTENRRPTGIQRLASRSTGSFRHATAVPGR